jgi:excisionase family DNA binding protein
MGSNTITPEQILSTEQVAEYLGITPRHTRHLATRGEIRGQLVGKNWIFVGSDVIGWKPKRGPGRPPTKPQEGR